MPWQRHVADIVLEVDPDTGELVYDEFGLTVPRQAGKSTWLLAKAAHRATATGFFGRRQRIVYTAQTRNKAREKWEQDFVEALELSSYFAGRVKKSLANGNEHVKFTNGSRFGIEANTPKSGHGPTIDEAYIDEAFAQIDDRLKVAFGPAMITRRNKQLGWVSTAGWINESPFLESRVKRGREAADTGRNTGLAYFEWSADPDADPLDPATWWSCHPALGHTITEAAIASELENMADNINGFRRSYLNLWVPKESKTPDPVIDMQRWADLADDRPPKCETVGFAVDISSDREYGSVAFAGRRPDGKIHLELIEYRAGREWMVPLIKAQHEKRPDSAVVLNATGPAGSLVADLVAAGVPVTAVGGKEIAAGCGQLYDGVKAGTVSHFNQPPLNVAVGSCRKRPYGTDAFVWNFKAPTDQSPLIAVTLGIVALDKAPKRKRTGKVW